MGYARRCCRVRRRGSDARRSKSYGAAAQRRLSALCEGRLTVPSLRRNGTVTAKRARQTLTVSPLSQPAPNAENGTNRFRPSRVTNEERRPREHLSRDEVLTLCKAARRNRNGTRDAAAIWLAFNHGLRISELCDLRWSGIQWQERRI